MMMGLSSFFLRFLPLVSDEASDFALLMAAFAPLDAISSQGGELYAAWPAARVSRYALCAGGGGTAAQCCSPRGVSGLWHSRGLCAHKIRTRYWKAVLSERAHRIEKRLACLLHQLHTRR